MIIHIYMGAPMMFTWVTWRLVIFLAPCLVHLMLEELHPTLGWRDIWLRNIIIGSNILCYFMLICIFMGVFMILLGATWSIHVFFAPFLVHILVEALHPLLGWNNTWLSILMHIILFWRRIMGHGILTYGHWGRSNIILDSCVYGLHDDILTWMYKHFHDCLMRYLIDVHLYDVVM